ncbi:hypothetical protein [Alkalinema sp. FACHB-956]|uniref:hypothetical protein n=1 Tax=Alkalinema sp. FACHB-956 TaxID=2692768 RepID=UPI0016874EA5|nr:hypothetical protein [Alkalinema sp. FACHB-956]MBD2329240.1 hypothetical protein [Alkalinema sp. FACHB-956]
MHPNQPESAVLDSVLDSNVAVIDRPAAQSLTIVPEQTVSDDFAPKFCLTTSKTSPASKWVGLAFLVSFALHSVLLFVPTQYEAKSPPKTEAKEKQIRITKIPKLKRIKPPTKLVQPPAPKPVIPSPTVIPPISQLEPKPQPKPEEPPALKPEAKPEEAAPTSPASGDESTSSWDDFPNYPGAQPNCFGLAACLHTADPLTQIAQYYTKELPTKQYAIKLAEQDPLRQVFQVSRKGETQFLSILQTENGQAIVLSDAPRTLDDLRKAVEVPPEVAALLNGLAVEKADPSNLVQPALAYAPSKEKGFAAGAAVPKPEVVNISLGTGYTDNMMSEFFGEQLKSNGYTVIDLPDFGGGKLYRIEKSGNTPLFLSLLPSKAGDGVVIITWQKQPS